MKTKLLHIVTVLILLVLSGIIYAQAPDLGTSANFVLFSSTGNMTNTGSSNFTGNIGVNTGSINTFGNVNGVMHNNDDSSLECATDLLVAYNQLNSKTPTGTHIPALGSGETLNPGIYLINGNALLNLVLTLDGQGNANSLFIFQVQGTFSSGVSARVNLINGAKACKVFWKVEGVVSLAAATIMKGTIIANNAAINISSGVSLEGRALSTAGAITVDEVSANTPVAYGSPLLTGPIAPDLGSTAAYALFSAAGSFTNTGSTYITGDIGTNAGTIAGYNSSTVVGTIRTGPNASTQLCNTDLVNIYDYLDGLPYDIELLYPEQFGNNLVLTPHTYIMKAAATFTDTLYLDAEGNADAVFVIQVNGAFSTSVSAKVMLINGAQAKNVFWQVEGAVDIKSNSEFKGTIVCNGAIDLRAGVNLEGRALTLAGEYSTAAIITTMPDFTTLPVSLLYFRGKPVLKNVMLEWGTANEINNNLFTIEKSSDGRNFEILTTINAAKRTVNAEAYYSITDMQPYAISFYRISQTDNNGQKSYIRTIQVKTNIDQSVKSLPYIQGDYIYVRVFGLLAGNGSIELYSIDGRKISSQKIALTPGANTYKIEKPSQKGMYQIGIESRGEKLYGEKVVVL